MVPIEDELQYPGFTVTRYYCRSHLAISMREVAFRSRAIRYKWVRYNGT